MNDPLADFFAGFNTTATGNRKNNRPCEGRGRYMLEKFGVVPTDNFGPAVEAELRVISPSPKSERAVGDKVKLIWYISKGPKDGGDNEKARGRDFVNALLGRPNLTPAQRESAMFAGPNQPGKGMIIDIVGVYGTYVRRKDGRHPGQEKGTTAQSQEFEFYNVGGQSNESVVKNRQALEAGALGSGEAPVAAAPHAATAPEMFPVQMATTPVASPFANPAATVTNNQPVYQQAPAPAAAPTFDPSNPLAGLFGR